MWCQVCHLGCKLRDLCCMRSMFCTNIELEQASHGFLVSPSKVTFSNLLMFPKHFLMVFETCGRLNGVLSFLRNYFVSFSQMSYIHRFYGLGMPAWNLKPSKCEACVVASPCNNSGITCSHTCGPVDRSTYVVPTCTGKSISASSSNDILLAQFPQQVQSPKNEVALFRASATQSQRFRDWFQRPSDPATQQPRGPNGPVTQ